MTSTVSRKDFEDRLAAIFSTRRKEVVVPSVDLKQNFSPVETNSRNFIGFNASSNFDFSVSFPKRVDINVTSADNRIEIRIILRREKKCSFYVSGNKLRYFNF